MFVLVFVLGYEERCIQGSPLIYRSDCYFHRGITEASQTHGSCIRWSGRRVATPAFIRRSQLSNRAAIPCPADSHYVGNLRVEVRGTGQPREQSGSPYGSAGSTAARDQPAALGENSADQILPAG